MWRRKVLGAGTLEKELNASFPYTVMSVLLYGAETWPVMQAENRRLRTLQMWCLRYILGLTLWDRQRNVDILKQVGEFPVEEQLKQRQL